LAVTLVDSNIFMYAAGRAHPLKHRAGAFLEKAAAGAVQAAIDAEALQEILHRYRALERWKEGRVVYDTARLLFPEVLAVTGEVMDGARRLMDEEPGLMARDALHAAVVAVYGLASITSFERDFDRVEGLRWVEP
jgi:predicted nucleic acid-binding protein